MSHIKGYVQFISEQTQDQTELVLKKRIAHLTNLIQNAKESGSTQAEAVFQKRLDVFQKRLDNLLQTRNPTTTSDANKTPVDNNANKTPVDNNAKKSDANKPPVVAKKQKRFQIKSSGRGNEALRARNIARAKARKQNPTVNTKPTLNKAGTDSGSGVDALRQRMIKRSEERGK